MKRSRYLIISDIHANEAALSAVLRSVKRRRYEAVLCMGDLVGYGASPNPVIHRLKALKHFKAVRGNHDKVGLGVENGDNFNTSARLAIMWTREKLTPINRAFLASLPKGPLEVLPGIVIAHGSTVHEDTYIFSEFDGREAFEAHPFRLCFIGHTHYPSYFVLKGNSLDCVPVKEPNLVLDLDPDARYLVNPGSVGQPRNRNPMATFAEYYTDPERIVFRAIPYDIEAAAEKIRRAGLPDSLWKRLHVGS